jgi:hypothetical protein
VHVRVRAVVERRLQRAERIPLVHARIRQVQDGLPVTWSTFLVHSSRVGVQALAESLCVAEGC